MQPISLCFNTRLSDICQRAIEIETLNLLVKKFLPEHLALHCKVASFLKGSLVLAVENAVWTTELHYQLGELRDRLRKEGGLYQLVSIKISVSNNPYEKIVQPKAPNTIPLSQATQEILLNSSMLCDYPPLKNALFQLANSCDEGALKPK